MPIRSYSKGARKALASMKARYGKSKGLQIFYARANKYAGKKRGVKAINATYTKGKKPSKRKP